MNALPRKKYTVDEYLQMELTAAYKSEYYNGEIFPMGEIEGDTPEAMAGALPPHNAVSSNIIHAFVTQLRDRKCNTFGGNQRIFTPETGLYTYPDVSVFCGNMEYQDKMTLKNLFCLRKFYRK